MSVVNVLFGIFNAGEDFVIVNHVILVTKFYIYRCKLNGVKPATRVSKTKKRSNTQYRKAFMRLNKVEFHDKKNGKKSNVLLMESTPPPPFFLSVIVIYLFQIWSITID